MVFFHLDTAESYNMSIVSWLSDDLTRYYYYIVVSTAIWFILVAILWMLYYTCRQRMLMNGYLRLADDIGMGDEYLLDIALTFTAFDVNLDGIIPKDDLKMAFYRLSQKDERGEFAFQTLASMDTNDDGFITFSEFSVAIIEALHTHRNQHEEIANLSSREASHVGSLAGRRHTLRRSRGMEPPKLKVHDWNVGHVAEWLHCEGLFQYIEAFTRNGVDGEILLSLTEEELRNDLKVRQIATRRKIWKSISALRDVSPRAGMDEPFTNLEVLRSSSNT